MIKKLKGLIPAVFTPMREDGSLNPDQVVPIVEHLLSDKVAALYVCGSTGEGPSLTSEERMATAKMYVEAVGGHLPVIIQVGHNSLAEARKLAEHAQKIGADAISAVPPSYFKINSLNTLVSCLTEITSAAPDLPFYYYHIPYVTGVNFDMVEFLHKGAEHIPKLVGIKFSNFTVFEFQACLEYQDGRFDILFGSDEMLTSGLAGGAQGAVGSTFNFAAPLYNKIINAFQQADMAEARRLQALSVKMVRVLYRYRGQSAFKGIMKLIGVDCGPNRLPHVTLNSDELTALKKELDDVGFFEWART